jgi:hypothetical protein
MREIHQIPAGDLLVVMEVDERLRSGSVDTDDLERLRQILGRRQQAD